MYDKTILNNRGAELAASGDYEGAEKTFHQALAASPGDPLVCYNIGYTLLKKGKKPEAVRWFDNAVIFAGRARHGWDGELALDCGLACYEAALYEEAEKFYQAAGVTGLESGEYFNRFGVLYFVTERYTDALSFFEKAVAADPDHPDAWFNLADTCDVLGFEEKALAARTEFLRLEKKKGTQK